MGWVLRLVESGADGSSDSVDVLEIERPGDLGDLADLGLTHAEGKQLLTRVQQAVVAAQSRDHAARRPACRTCGAACQLKDYRPHQIATVFGPVTVRLPRFRCAGCDRAEAGIGWPAHCRSTPELDQLRAQYAALLPYRVAAGVLAHLLPVVFAAVARTDTEVEALIRRSLQEVGQTADTALTAFTDGCPGLRSILAEAGITEPPFLDWFHIAMRLEHAGKTAGSLPGDTPEQERAKTVIVAEVDRLHWRIWHGKASDARITLERIRELMPAFRGERGRGAQSRSARRLWTALHEIDHYLTSQSAWLINYAERQGAGQRVGTSITEGTANFLVNRRMNKEQQMRWSRRGADRLLQVRCAVINGKLGFGLGQLFEAEAEANSISGLALAA